MRPMAGAPTTVPAANRADRIEPPVAAAIVAAIQEAGVNGRDGARLRDAVLEIARGAIDANDRRRSEQVEGLLATAGRVTESLDLETVLAAIVEDARSLLGADSGDMLL